MYTINAESVLRRLKRLYNIETDFELAQFLGVSAPTVSNWKTRGSIDFSLVFSKCSGVNYHYILTGEGHPFAENEFGAKLAEELTHSPEHHSQNKVNSDKISQLTNIVSSLKDIFNGDMQASLERLINQHKPISLPADLDLIETENSNSNVIDSLSRQLTRYVYKDDVSVRPEEKENLRTSLIHNIHSTLSLSFGISTRILPKPLKVLFLMQRIKDILSPIVSNSFLINIQMGLEEIIGPIIDSTIKAREEVDIYLQFTLDHEKLTITIQDFSEYNRIYSTNNHQLYTTENSKERAHYHQGIQLARQLMDEVFLTVEPGRCITIIVIKYFSISEDK